MKVIICENNINQLAYTAQTIRNYAMIEDNGISIALATPDPHEVIRFLEKEKADCFFLDIDLESNINGLELADYIRNKDTLASIIFITTHNQMIHLTFQYKIAALDFIVKDDFESNKNHLIHSLATAFNRYRQLGKEEQTLQFQVKIGSLVRNIPYDEIYFFESSSNSHKIVMHTKKGLFEFYGTLKDILNLNQRFFRCHKSYIVNLKLIFEINKKDRLIIMENKEVCPVSHRLIQELDRSHSLIKNIKQ